VEREALFSLDGAIRGEEAHVQGTDELEGALDEGHGADGGHVDPAGSGFEFDLDAALAQVDDGEGVEPVEAVAEAEQRQGNDTNTKSDVVADVRREEEGDIETDHGNNYGHVVRETHSAGRDEQDMEASNGVADSATGGAASSADATGEAEGGALVGNAEVQGGHEDDGEWDELA